MLVIGRCRSTRMLIPVDEADYSGNYGCNGCGKPLSLSTPNSAHNGFTHTGDTSEVPSGCNYHNAMSIKDFLLQETHNITTFQTPSYSKVGPHGIKRHIATNRTLQINNATPNGRIDAGQVDILLDVQGYKLGVLFTLPNKELKIDIERCNGEGLLAVCLSSIEAALKTKPPTLLYRKAIINRLVDHDGVAKRWLYHPRQRLKAPTITQPRPRPSILKSTTLSPASIRSLELYSAHYNQVIYHCTKCGHRNLVENNHSLSSCQDCGVGALHMRRIDGRR